MKNYYLLSESGRQMAKARSRHWLQIQGSIDSLILPVTPQPFDYQGGLLSASASKELVTVITNDKQWLSICLF